MRKYTLASPTAKTTVDLRDYANIITNAVHSVMPSAIVKVDADCYYVDPTPTQGDAVRIGRQICQSALKVYCVQIPKLFTSIEIEKEATQNGTTPKHTGGHH